MFWLLLYCFAPWIRNVLSVTIPLVVLSPVVYLILTINDEITMEFCAAVLFFAHVAFMLVKKRVKRAIRIKNAIKLCVHVLIFVKFTFMIIKKCVRRARGIQ